MPSRIVLLAEFLAIPYYEFSPDGTRVLAVVPRANAAVVLDLNGEEGQELVRLNGKQRLLYGTWSPNGQSVLTTWDDGSVRRGGRPTADATLADS